MRKNKKILQVFGSLNMGGAESRMMDVYRNIDRTKIKFDFVTLESDVQYYEREICELGGAIYKLDSPKKVGVISHIKQLRECMRCGKYDVVHAHTSYHIGLVMLCAWLEKVPVRIAHARTNDSKNKSVFKNIMLFGGRTLIWLFSTKKIAISEEAGKFLFGSSSFEVVPNSIVTEKYQNVKVERINEMKRELALPDDAMIVGQIGRFDEMKNHRFSVRWFAQFIEEYPNSYMVFVGDGGLRLEIEEFVRKLGLSKNVIFTGIRGDVYELIHIFDVLFFPSVFEGLGGVVLEAQAAGVPVVESNNVPCITDLGLELVKRCALNADYKEWNKCVHSVRNISIPDYNTINEAFERAGFSLSTTIKKYIEIYGGE